jgi:phasin family protein
MKAKHSTTEAAAEGGNKTPLYAPDLRRLFDAMKLPKVDVQGLIEASGKDVEALLAANRRAFEGYQEFNRKQAEILARTMQQLQSGARDLVSGQPAPASVSGAAQRAQQLFNQALTDMQTMAEVAARAHEDIVTIVNRRIGEGLNAIGASIGKSA